MTKVFYIIAILSLIISFFKSKEKTKMVLKKAWKSFENIMPQFLAIILVIGIMLAVLTPEQISRFLGQDSGIMEVVMAVFIGAWSTMKIPLLIFESTALGYNFSMLRLGINIIGIPLIAFIINLFLKEKDREEIYQLAQEKNI